MKLALFVYNFRHKKTQDFLLRLFLEHAQVSVVLAADSAKLKVPLPSLRVKPQYCNLLHPNTICHRLGWRYEVVDHSSKECAKIIRDLGVDLGIIAGARIIREPVLSAPRIGIINFHPALLPEGRGLDALQWTIYEDRPLGVTAHFIDERVDAGRIILKQQIEVCEDDTLIDLSLRLDETQVEILPEVLKLVERKEPDAFPVVEQAKLHKKMPPELEKQLPERLKAQLMKVK